MTQRQPKQMRGRQTGPTSTLMVVTAANLEELCEMTLKLQADFHETRFADRRTGASKGALVSFDQRTHLSRWPLD